MILALVLTLTAAAAFADLSWNDNQQAAAQIDGEFHTYDEPGLKCWIPTVLQQVDLSEEERKSGYIDYFATADDSSAVAVQYLHAGIHTVEEYCNMLNAHTDVSDINTISVNGLNAAIYAIKATDVTCISIPKGDGYVYEMTFYPMSDDGFSAVAVLIASSIQAK